MIHGVAVVAYIVASLLRSAWRRYCIYRGAIIACIVAHLLHISAAVVGILIAYIAALLLNIVAPWLYRAAVIAYTAAQL